MNRPDLSDVQTLYHHENGPCVSLFLPTHRAGPDIRQDPIRMKNHLREAREKLEERGMSPEAAEDFLSEGSALLEDREFWRHQSGGLAVFIAAGQFRIFQVAAELEELVVVGPRFHLLPLLPHVGDGERFHVLALSQKRVRLFEGDADELREVEAEHIPDELRDVVGYDFEQRTLQFHSAGGQPVQAPATGPSQTTRAAGRRRALFHGHGEPKDADLTELERFVRRVDDVVVQLVGASPPPPMILAAVERVAVAYRSVSRHPRLVEKGLEGNPDPLQADDLHRRSLELLESLSGDDVGRAIEEYEARKASDRASDDLQDIVSASEAGRVELLLYADDGHCWGRFDPRSREIETREEPGAEDEDLVDRAALECLLQGGRIVPIPPARIPSDGPLAAVYRYSLSESTGAPA